MINLYIPGFGNQADDIYKNRLNTKETSVVQKNLRPIANTKFRKIISEISSITDKLIEKRYLQRYEIPGSVKSKEKFRGATRSIELTTKLTLKKIEQIDFIELLSGHSQGGLIAMLCVLKNQEILSKIGNIELLAPVLDSSVGKSFHKGKEKSYLHPKNVLVRKEYIDSFDVYNENLLKDFLELIKSSKWHGSLKIVFGGDDKLIDKSIVNGINLEDYDFLRIQEIEEGDHYLGYKN